MKTEDKKMVVEAIDGEGFDYAMFHYSDWKEVKDKKFHNLRKQYINATREIKKYIGYSKLGHGFNWAWLIQQLLPYCTDNEDKDTLRNSDLL